MRHRWHAAVSGVVCLVVVTALSNRAGAATYIQTENAKAGTSEWKLTAQGLTSGVIEGYASATSVNRGETIRLFVNTHQTSYTMDIFRLGDYQGLGGRRMMPTITLAGIVQPTCPMDSTTGMVECSWLSPYSLTIPNNSADPTDWMSGIYVVKLTASDPNHTQQYIKFVVRDDQRFTDILFQDAVSTDQAYNPWGGKSLYGTLANPTDTANKANKVSFDRPYYGDDNNGVGNLFNSTYWGWEFNMLRWLEQQGYDVSYATSVDVDANSNLLLNHKAFLSVGHDEYWSWKMRDNVENAIKSGVSVGFFSGNVSYWQVRFESGIANPTPGRVVVGYKENWQQDPITPDYYKTNEFRYSPVNRPEDVMVGGMFVTQAKPAFCVEDASHWVFTGTNLKNGDCLTNPDGSPFLGYEVDAMVGPGSPLNTQRVGHSPVDAKGSNFSDMVIRHDASGSTVVSTGSIGWSQSVPQIVQLTKNILARFTTNAFADTTPIRPQLPSPFQSQDIGDTGRPGFVSMAGPDSFTLEGAGQDTFNGNDAQYYAYQTLSGDGQIVARLTGLRLYWDNRAGLMIRESLAANARYVALVGRPSGSIGAVNEGVEFWTRSVAGAFHTTIAQRDQAIPNWLKLTRTGSTFQAFTSADGISWSLLGSTTLALNSTVYIGAVVQSSQYRVWATARFDHVSVSGSPGPAPVLTTVTVTPQNATVIVGSTQAFTAQAFDQFGNPMQATYTWSSSNPGVGTIASASGRFSASSVGTTVVSAVAGTVSGTSTVTVNAGSVALPAPWASQDVGSPGAAGTTTYSSGQFTVQGSGADIWGTADAFQFAYQPLTGDGQIVARLTSIQNTNTYAKAGVMIRSDLTSSAANVMLDVRPSGEIEFMARSTAGGSTAWLAGGSSVVPGWLKLVRAGSTITSYQSADGTTWNQVGSVTVNLGAAVEIGLVVTSHAAGVLNTSTFDNVTVSASVTTAPTDIVLYAGDIASSAVHGMWTPTSDPTSPNGVKLATPAVGWSTASAPLASPADYVDVAFNANAGTPYTLWMRLQATNNSKASDSVWVQFSDAFAGGTQVFPMNSTSGLLVKLASDSTGASDNRWGWVNSAYWLAQTTTFTFPTSGAHTMRIQVRYSGVQFDQIVLSPATYFNPSASCPAACGAAPGPITNDSTIVPKPTAAAAPGAPASPNPANGATGVSVAPTLTWTATNAATYDVSFGATNPPPLVLTGQSAASYTPPGLTSATTYYWRIVARNSGGSTTGAVWSFTTAAPQPPPAAPASPAPANGSTGVGTSPTLTWTSAGATSYDVRFGATNPPPQVVSAQPAASYSPTGLTAGTTFFWQIVAKNSGGSTTGPVWSFSTGSAPSNIVIYASDIAAATIHGVWSMANDSTSPNGLKLATPTGPANNTTSPLAAPADYVDVPFTAPATTPYTVWLRVAASNNSKYSDSLYVQFSDAVANGAPAYAINTTAGLNVNLATDSTGASDQGWGWVNGAYWLMQPATVSFATSGSHTLRLQVREYGVMFDQIVLSPALYFNGSASCPNTCANAPGPLSNDHTIVPKTP